VAVRDKHAPYTVLTVLEILGVGEYVVDPRRIGLSKLEAAVDDNDVLANLDRGHVAAYLLYVAKRDNADIARLERRYRALLLLLGEAAFWPDLARRVRLVRPGAALAYAATAAALAAEASAPTARGSATAVAWSSAVSLLWHNNLVKFQSPNFKSQTSSKVLNLETVICLWFGACYL
jgi:hypothetical protein